MSRRAIGPASPHRRPSLASPITITVTVTITSTITITITITIIITITITLISIIITIIIIIIITTIDRNTCRIDVLYCAPSGNIYILH